MLGTSDVDLLASMFYAKLHRFVSRTRDSHAIGVEDLVTVELVLSNLCMSTS